MEQVVETNNENKRETETDESQKVVALGDHHDRGVESLCVGEAR
jgi:hypothetical protein